MSKIGCGHEPRLGPDDLDILPGGVENLDHAVVGHQVVERAQVDAGGQGIDDRFVIGASQLDQAELRPEGLLANELGIDGDKVVPAEALTEHRSALVCL